MESREKDSIEEVRQEAEEPAVGAAGSSPENASVSDQAQGSIPDNNSMHAADGDVHDQENPSPSPEPERTETNEKKEAEYRKFMEAAQKNSYEHKLNEARLRDQVGRGLKFNRNLGSLLADAAEGGSDLHDILEGRLKRQLSPKALKALGKFNHNKRHILDLLGELESEPMALKKAKISQLKEKVDAVWAQREKLLRA